MRVPLLLVLLVATLPAQAQTADSARIALPDTLAAVDSLAAAADSLRMTVLSDSAGRALDSAAVVALSDTSDALPEDVLEGVAVTLYGRDIFTVYGGLGSLSVSDRARRIGERLDSLTKNEGFEPDSLSVVAGDRLTTIQFGDLIVMSVTDADAEAQTLSRSQAAAFYARTIRSEVLRVRDRSTLRSVLINAGVAAALLMLLGLILWGLGRAFRWANARFLALHREKLPGLSIRGIEVVRGEQIVTVGTWALRLVRFLVSVLIVYVFATLILGLFPWSQSWSKTLLAYLISPVQAVARLVVDGLPDFFAIVVVVALVRWAIKGSNWVFHQVETGALTLPGFYPEFADPTRKIARFLLIIVGLFLAYPYTPLADNAAFQGLTVLIGILFSIGSSTAIANVVAGTVLTYTRSFQLGDRIKVGETTGDVVEKTFLVTRLCTPKNEVVSIPNATVLSGQVTNFSEMIRDGRGVIVHTEVTIGYDVPWEKTHGLLLEAAHRAADDPDNGVVIDPPPFVLQTSLGDFSVAYQLNVYTRQARKLPKVLSDLHARIQDVFAEADVEILSPVYQANRDGSPSTVPPPTIASAAVAARSDGDGA